MLSGEIQLFTEYYEPLVLQEGDSVYYDSSMGHACVSLSREDAMVLWVTTC